MKWINRDFQPPPPYVGLVTDPKKFRRACARLRCKETPLFPEGKPATTWFMRNESGKSCAFVCINRPQVKGYTKPEVYGLLVHEAVHVWQEWMSDIGEEKPGQEQEAYAVQWISAKLMEAWEKLK